MPNFPNWLTEPVESEFERFSRRTGEREPSPPASVHAHVISSGLNQHEGTRRDGWRRLATCPSCR